MIYDPEMPFTCPVCKGTGAVRFNSMRRIECHSCKGTGVVWRADASNLVYLPGGKRIMVERPLEDKGHKWPS